MRILLLSGWWPYPPNNGSKLRVFNLLRALAARHTVTLLAFADHPPTAADLGALRRWCADVAVVAWHPFRPRSLRARLGYLSTAPRSIVDTFSREMQQRITDALVRERCDLVIASEMRTASYAQFFAGVPAILEELELGVLHAEFAAAGGPWRRLRHALGWLKLRRYLARLLPAFRACTVVSERERQLLRRAVPHYRAVEVVPNCVNLDDYTGIPAAPIADRLIFAGTLEYFANHDGISWFLHEVLPLLRAQRPTVEVVITGAPGAVVLPPMPNVRRLGLVDDIRPVVASASVSLAPLRLGGGTRMKILEAMALRTPVVATTKGAEGLEVVDGEHLLIADDPSTFAARVLRLLSDQVLRAHLVGNARRLIEQKYDVHVVGRQLVELVEAVGSSEHG